ncbi:MAG: EI24 domain-containing protein [Flavobacteriales bacterium]|nr:EI24 domain-containing protein [Flavobacteriales bacterium]
MTFFEKLRLGFKSFSKAHQFIKQHRLWHFVYIPGVVNAIFFLLFINWVTSSITEWVDGIFSFDCDDSFLGWFCSIFSFLTNFLEYFIRLMLYTALIGVYLFIYKSIILLLYSPVLAYLIEVVDKKHKGIDTPFKLEQFLKDSVRGIVLATRGILLEGLIIIALIIMAFVPIINIIQPILMWLVSSYFLGVSMLDYALERKGLNVKESIIYSKQNKSLASSIGSVFQLVFFIPAIGWMLAPTYSAVAAYFAVDELDKGKY